MTLDIDPSDIWDLDRDWIERQPTPDYLDEIPSPADTVAPTGDGA